MRKWPVLLGFFALLLLALFAASFYVMESVRSVSVEGAEILSIENITLEGFMLKGNLLVHNPSMISIKAGDINTEVRHKAKGALLSTGTIEGATLLAESDTKLPFNQYVYFGNVASLALDVMQENETIITFSGEMPVSRFFKYSIRFEREMDVNKPLRDYAQKKLGELSGFISGLFG